MITQQPDTQPPCPSSSTEDGKQARAEALPAVPGGFSVKAREPEPARGTWQVRALIPPLLAQKVLGRPAEVGGG